MATTSSPSAARSCAGSQAAPTPTTAGSTAQLCPHSDGSDQLRCAGATVWGISPQGLDRHGKCARNRRPDMPLLSDEERVVAKSFGNSAPLIGLRRSVFIINGCGRLHRKHVTAVGAAYPPTVTPSTRLAGLTG
ncbi:redoxin domain-containing protein [Streptomyces filamentosus]